MEFFKKLKQLFGHGEDKSQEKYLADSTLMHDYASHGTRPNASGTSAELALAQVDIPVKGEDFQYLVREDQTVTITRFIGQRNVEFLSVPPFLEGKPVTSIGRFAFVESYDEVCDEAGIVNRFEFPETQSIPEHIHLPDTVDTIEEYAFAYLYQLKGINLPTSLKIIGKAAFIDCESLDFAFIPSCLEVIAESAFSGTNIQTLRLPDSIVTIGREAFYNCRNLRSISIPNHIRIIEKNTFRGCEALVDIKLPEELKQIGDGAFAACGFRKIELPVGLNSIGTYSFCNCQKLTEVHLPVTLVELSYFAFMNCYSLRYAEMPSSIKLHGSVWSYCHSLQKITLTETCLEQATFVEDDVFTDKNKEILFYPPYKTSESFTVPAGTTSIGESAFTGHPHIVSITLRADTTRLGFEAFYSCPKLKDVVLGKRVSEIGSDAFANYDLLTVYFEAGSLTEKTLADYDTDTETLISDHSNVQFKPLTQRPKTNKKKAISISVQQDMMTAKEDAKRILVDKTWSIAIPEGYLASTKASLMAGSSVHRVLAMARCNNVDDLKLVFSHEENISASKLPKPNDLKMDFHSREGSNYVNTIISTLAMPYESRWETLIAQDNLLVGFCENTQYGPTRFVAGVFTPFAAYSLQMFYHQGNLSSKEEKARNILKSIRGEF